MGCNAGKEQGTEYTVTETAKAAPADPADPADPAEPLLSATDAAAEDKSEVEKIAKMKNKPRRSGVSAEPVTVDPNWVPPKFEKTPEERESILAKVKTNRDCQVLIGHLSADSMNTVADALFRKVVPSGENLITQGDEGDNFYIVETGQFDIFVTRGDPPQTNKVMTAQPGAIFGQLALLYNAPRAATCTAVGDSDVWAMDRKTFRNLLISDESTKKKTYESFLENVDIMQHLNDFERSQVADLLIPESYEAAQNIISQGEEGDSFFFVNSGICSAFISGEQGEIEVKKYDAKGQYFGEIAMLEQTVRRATVRAGPDGCEVLKLKKEDFNRNFMPLIESMKQNVNRYPKYGEFFSKS